jgi:hypothetical protein
MRKSPEFSPEVIERGVRMVFDAKVQYPSQRAAIESIGGKIGCTAETLRGAPGRARERRAARAYDDRAAAHQGTRA